MYVLLVLNFAPYTANKNLLISDLQKAIAVLNAKLATFKGPQNHGGGHVA